MKFQKTLLAASLAVAAVSANAAHTWTDVYGNVQQQVSPVEVLNNYYAEALSQDTSYLYQTGETHAADYGSKLPTSLGNIGYTDPNALVAKYGINGQTIVEVIARQAENAEATKTYYVENANRLTQIAVTDFDSTKLVKENFLEGGVVTSTFNRNGEIEEIKRINNETVKYGQISSTNSTSVFEGATTAPNGPTNEFVRDVATENQYNEKSVELGILTQKVLGDVTSNVYGVSAKDGNSVATLTGKGLQTNNIVLANGDIETVDGRHGITSLVATTNSANQLVSQYVVAGKNVWVVTDVTTQEKQYFTGQENALVEYLDSKDVLTADKLVAGGAATTVTGVYRDSSVRNVISDQKVTYSEKSFEYDASRLTGQTTDAAGSIVSQLSTNSNQQGARNQKEQSVDLGIIAKDATDNSNVYGLEVKKTTTNAEGQVSTKKTTITADYVDSGDFRINGVSIVDNIKESVDGAVAGATEAIDAKVAEVDERLTEFKTTAGQLNSRVNQLNSRIDDVEKTAYRGVAIALAAQQQIPNIGAGQFAVFGGVGHYEGESAGALGVASVFADGRTSVSAALGFAGGNEVGGRVGVSYVFGGK
ncbi:YadA C-terminal domain-containing protein [Acinetobacter sp. YH12102]|uniref:YadA C-terminal domain-containing protein n=1 Tax=Acinetobacter sp. YH12102 TaxID=2601091 RepID=UPI0015D32141|nr:YadA C-terminal domain-containing protein [Acinetobacter sp. YH12102]